MHPVRYSATSQCQISSATSAVPCQQCHVTVPSHSATSAVPRHSARSAVPCQTQCHVSSDVRHSATSAVPCQTMPRQQQCHVSNRTGLPGQLPNETIAAFKQRCLAQIEAEEQCLLAVEAARVQAEEAAAAEKLRLQADADADAQARHKEAQDLLQRHEANSIDRLKYWHFKPNGDEATPEEKHKEFLSKLVTRLLYACNYQRSELERQYQELATLRLTVQSHEDATRALNAQLLDLEQAALVALSAKKQVYAPLKSAFSREAIRTFIREAGYGGRDIMSVSTIPQVQAIGPWDGKDGELIEEEEFSLSDLMGGDDDGEVAEKEADNDAEKEL
ncbi:hypothetical protein CBR_g42178 [Chara braunii]|uniref:Uncharacterized protein n=1 Tax=Chara braunii TaxID=69332 RepID=A0A388LXA2_CHABU|nr:hypothetical protein CBR_g42178 [Chara braunii]|eukprot:GBG86895.1 hypothetical protein CBR_g42178 [Chara braunii]